MFIFRTVAVYPESLFLIMSTYIPSCPCLHFKDSCGRPWNYCPPILSSPLHIGASWSGSYPLILLITNSTPVLLCALLTRPFQSTLPSIFIFIRFPQSIHIQYLLRRENINVTQSSRADCQACAGGCAQTVARQEQCNWQDAPKIALGYVLVVSAILLFHLHRFQVVTHAVCEERSAMKAKIVARLAGI